VLCDVSIVGILCDWDYEHGLCICDSNMSRSPVCIRLPTFCLSIHHGPLTVLLELFILSFNTCNALGLHAAAMRQQWG
jgi:hypothetical protein